jgi:predicted permease
MINAFHIIELIIPIFFMAAIGVVTGWFFKFPADTVQVLTRYVVYVAGPASLITAIADSNLEYLLNPRLLLTTICTYSVVYVGIILFHMLVLRRNLADSAFAGFSIAKFNLLIIGLPLILSIVGSKGISAFVINAFVSYLLLTPITLFLHGLSSGDSEQKQSPSKLMLKAMAKAITNPLIIGAILGLVLLLLDAKIPVYLNTPLNTIGSSIIPVGLIAVGMFISNVKLRKWDLEVWLMSLTKMLVVPAITIGLALLFQLDKDNAVALVLLFSVPSAVVTYALARECGSYSEQSGEIVALTTITSAIFIPLTAYVCLLIWGL